MISCVPLLFNLRSHIRFIIFSQQNKVCLQHGKSIKDILKYNLEEKDDLSRFGVIACVGVLRLRENRGDEYMEVFRTQTDKDKSIAQETVYIAICDDEPFIRDSLKEKVEKDFPQARTELFSSGSELLASGIQPDILFLDIQMPKMDGMEAARLFRKQNKDTLIIFVTALEEYVFQAFDVGAFHYLVKPFSDDRFYEVFENALREVEARRAGGKENDEDYMMIQMGGIHTKIRLKDIVYAEVFNRKVIIHTVNGDTEYYGKLSELEEKVGEDFFRSHRSYLIHFKYVMKYDAASITMKNGTALIAKQVYPEFVKRYFKYNQKKGREIK